MFLIASSALTAFFDSSAGFADLDQLDVEDLVEAVVLALAVVDRDALRRVRLVEAAW